MILWLLLFLVVITDPGIKVDRGYKPYDDGISQGVFVKVCTCYVHSIFKLRVVCLTCVVA